MFLVTLRHTMDDLPIRLFSTEHEAVDFAQSVDEMPNTEVRKVFNTDASTPVSVFVTEFYDGVPVRSREVKNLSREPNPRDRSNGPEN